MSKWRKQLTIKISVMDDWNPRFHWDYGGWDAKDRHNVLFTGWVGCKLMVHVSMGRSYF